MRSPPRRRDGKLGPLIRQGLAQPQDEVSGQKGTVSRRAEHPLRVRSVGCGPIEPGQNSGERSRIILHRIGDNGQAKRREALGIAIGAEKQALALRRKPRDDAGQNRLAANFAQRLVAAAHPPRQAARQHHPRHVGRFNHRSRLWLSPTDKCKVHRPPRYEEVPAAKREQVDGPRTIRTCRPMAIIKLDLSGLKCPLPALKTRKALKSLTPGDRLEVRCTDPLAVIDIPHLVGVTGDRLEIIERGERDTLFRIEKAAPLVASKPAPSC
jgi:tRNA 2-thiouridine synthesizing protein A